MKSEDEILDVIDKEGNFVRTASKTECHSNPDLIHPTVHFTLFDKNNNKILLTKRSANKSHDGGKICFLGEHLATGERFEDGLVRGVKEELGVQVKRYKKMHVHLFRQPKQTELVTFFIAEWDGSKIFFDKDEIEEIFWITPKQLESEHYDYSEMTRYWINSLDWETLQKKSEPDDE